MQHYLVSIRQPEIGWSELEGLSGRMRAAAKELSGDGTDVRFVRVIFVPESDEVFLLYEAGRPDDVVSAAAQAGLRAESIVPAIPTVLDSLQPEGAV